VSPDRLRAAVRVALRAAGVDTVDPKLRAGRRGAGMDAVEQRPAPAGRDRARARQIVVVI
jgi:hypothetical protein